MDKIPQPLDYIIERALKEQMEFLTMVAIEGKIEDWAEYKYLCGEIRGIQMAMDALRDARKRVAVDGDFE